MSRRASSLVKFLDFYLGIPIIFFLGLFKKKQKKIPVEIKKIALLKTAALGDTTLLSAIIQDLHKALPQAEITLFAAKDNAVLAPFIPHLDKCIVLPVTNIFKSIFLLRKNLFDLFLDFGAWPRINAIFTFFAKAKMKIGFKTKGQYRHYIYDCAIPHNEKIHELENYRNIISCLQISEKKFPKLLFSDLKPPKFLTGKKYIVFHMWGSGCNPKIIKEWSQESWKKLFIFLNKDFDICLTGSNADFSKNEAFKKSCFSPKNLHNVANIPFSETLTILKNAQLVISINTGIMHVAAAIGTPLITLNGAVNINRWGALGKNVQNITSTVEDSQYLNLGFEYKGHRKDCMQYLLPEDVITALQKFPAKLVQQ